MLSVAVLSWLESDSKQRFATLHFLVCLYITVIPNITAKCFNTVYVVVTFFKIHI